MEDHILIDRLQFTLTVTFHYLFPILTMGLALFIAYMMSVAYLGRPDRRFRLLRRSDAERERYEGMARFWATIFAVNFAFGVVPRVLISPWQSVWAGGRSWPGSVVPLPIGRSSARLVASPLDQLEPDSGALRRSR
jgi:cytochrome bd ubiquinol oxidase subunit I